jgi:methyltransferase (TIGR00027 family)
MAEPPVSNVSDTARWVAVYRAWESARPDALFKDPFAAQLAGEKGRAIAAVVPRQARNGWPMITRTKLIDDLILASVKDGCDCVLNLGAGLDTRPYRLALPPSFSWIEADLPAMIEEKERLLAAEKPVCRLSREKIDLSDSNLRSGLLDRVGLSARKALILTEGLLIYLEESQVRSLAQDISLRPGIPWWVLDLASPSLMKMLQHQMGEHLANAPLKFAPPNGIAYFESLGWKPSDVCSMLRYAERFRRLPLLLRPFAHFPEPDPRHLGWARWSAVLRLVRDAAS